MHGTLCAAALKILFIKRDKLGDLLLTTPVLEHARAQLPHAELHVLANDYNAWVVRDHPAVTRLWVYPRVRHAGRVRLRAALAYPRLALALRAQCFDWAIVAGGDESPRGIRRALATRAVRTVAYAAAPAAYGSRLTDPLWPAEGHEVERMFRELEVVGVKRPDRLGVPTFVVPQAWRATADTWLAARGLARRRFIVLGLGARRARKQPSAEQIARWTTEWHARWQLPTVFMWTPGRSDSPLYPGDDDIAEPVLARKLPHLVPFRGPIPEAIGLLDAATASLVPDSGLMHFAAATPGGVIGLFAAPEESAPAARWAPIGPRASWLEAERAVSELPDAVIHAAVERLVEGTAAANTPASA